MFWLWKALHILWGFWLKNLCLSDECSAIYMPVTCQLHASCVRVTCQFLASYKWVTCELRASYMGVMYGLRLRWSRGNVLAFGTQVRGFGSGRSRRIFRAKKILSTPFFGGEIKPSVPYHSFTACKRTLNVTWNSAFRQNYQTFLAHSSTFCLWVLSRGDLRGDDWWRKLERLTQIAQ